MIRVAPYLTTALAVLVAVLIAGQQTHCAVANAERRLAQERQQIQQALERLEQRLAAVLATNESQAHRDAETENLFRERLHELELSVDDLRQLTTPLVSELPELPSSIQ